MKASDVAQLEEWLGPQGAMAGLERGHLTNAELMKLAREAALPVDPKAGRRALALELVMHRYQRIDKPVDFLLGLDQRELKKYFSERAVSNSELLNLLRELGIAPTGHIRSKLADYAAHEISDLGMFQRVAKGKRNTSGDT